MNRQRAFIAFLIIVLGLGLVGSPLAAAPTGGQPQLSRTMPEVEHLLLQAFQAANIASLVVWIGADTNGYLTVASIIFISSPATPTTTKYFAARAWKLTRLAFTAVPVLDEVHLTGVLPPDGEFDLDRLTVTSSAAISRSEFAVVPGTLKGSEAFARISRVWYGQGSDRARQDSLGYRGGSLQEPAQASPLVSPVSVGAAAVHTAPLHGQAQRLGRVPLRIVFRGDTARHDVAVTFDDGPFPIYTTLLLDTLERVKLKATFFLVGEQVQRYPYFAQAIVKAGHEIGNHTFHHVRLSQLPEPVIEEEIVRAQEVITEITGQRPIYFRPPGGRFAFPVIHTASALGLTTVFWTANSGDYRHEGVPMLEAKILGRVHPGGILLLHQGVGETTRILPGACEVLRRRGLFLTTMTGLLTLPRTGSLP